MIHDEEECLSNMMNHPNSNPLDPMSDQKLKREKHASESHTDTMGMSVKDVATTTNMTRRTSLDHAQSAMKIPPSELTTARGSSSWPYSDPRYSQQHQNQPNHPKPMMPIGGSTPNETYEDLPFPVKLHMALDFAHAYGWYLVFSWNVEGTSFRVHNPTTFSQVIMPKFFGAQSKYKSFQRQLNLYGFVRSTEPHQKGYYAHQYFRRGQPDLSMQMRIQKVKGVNSINKQGNTEALDSNMSSPMQQKSPGPKCTTDTNEQCTPMDISPSPQKAPPDMNRRGVSNTQMMSFGKQAKRRSASANDRRRRSSRTESDIEDDSDHETNQTRPLKRSKSEELSVFAGKTFFSVEDSILRDALL